MRTAVAENMSTTEIAAQLSLQLTRIKDNVIRQCLTNALGPDWEFESLKGRLTYREDRVWDGAQTTYWLDGKVLVTFKLPSQPMTISGRMDFKVQYETPYWEAA